MATTLTTARKAENKISFDATQAADVRRCLHLGRADEVEDVELEPDGASVVYSTFV